MARIAVNLAFVDATPLTGPGYFAVQLFEMLVRHERVRQGLHEIKGYTQAGAFGHFSPKAQEHLCRLPDLPGRISRVLYEHLILPTQTLRDRIDILYSPAFVTPLWGARHLVTAICDMYYRVVPELVEPFQRKFWSVMIPASVRVSSRIIAISSNSKKDIEAYLPEARGKTVSIPLASRFPVTRRNSDAAGSGDRPPFLLMVANLTPNKNCAVVVKAIARLREAGRDIEFIHAGKDNVGLLEQAIRDHDAGSYVRSIGKVPEDDLIRLYRECAAVVVPSLYEGFGMPAVEAQALGAPLICSDRAALPEAAGDGALYFDPEDENALAAQICRLLDMPPREREELAERAFANASSMSWERCAQETLEVFKDVLGR